MSVSMISVSLPGRGSGITAKHQTARPHGNQIRRMSPRFLLPACLALACLVCVTGGAATAWTQQIPVVSASSPPELTPAEAQRALSVLQDPAQRARLIETLQAIAKAAGPAPAPVAQATEPVSTAKPEAEKPGAVTLKPDSLAAQLVTRLAGWPQRVADDVAAALRTMPDLHLLRNWVVRMISDPAEHRLMLDVAWQLVLVLGAALLLERLAGSALRRPAARLAASAPDSAEAASESDDTWQRLRRLPVAAARLALELVPVAVFWAAATVLAGLVPAPLVRWVILTAINAYTVIRGVLAFGRMLLSPQAGGLRLVNISDERAAYLTRWLRRLTFVAVGGGAVAALALLLGLHPAVYATLIRLLGLAVAVMLAIIVLQLRDAVASYLRATSEEEPPSSWRSLLAATWHYLALLAIAAGWIGWAAGFEAGAIGIWMLLGTVAIIAGARLVALVLSGILDRMTGPRPGTDTAALGLLGGPRLRARRWSAVARPVVNVAVAILTGLVLLEFWGVGALGWFESGEIGARLLSALITIGLAALAAIIVWEVANAALERRLARLSEAGTPAHAARLRTLLPMLRAALLVTVGAIVGLTALSEIGINIAPLLAGAGIVGVAIGFGSQKLVQDVVTGLFVLFENAIQVGDWVTVAGLSGRIERLSVRTIWLRGGDGALHVVPFSSVGTISNTNRGLGTAAVSVTIAYSEDSDRAAEVMRGIIAEMRQEPEYADRIIDDLQLWVDSVRALGVTLSGVIPCTDAGRWPVQREFNRRLQKRFQEIDIAMGLRLGDA
jgi:small-conductance mechanosensitive channel